MPHITINAPVVGQPDSTEEPKITTDLNTIADAVNGNLGGSNLLPAFLKKIVTTVGTPGSGSLATGKTWGMDFGASSIAFSNSQNSAPVTVNHGLAAAPPIILTSAFGSPGGHLGATIYGITSGASQLQFSGWLSAATTWTIFFYWCAISFVNIDAS